jgi:hypothetical protein
MTTIGAGRAGLVAMAALALQTMVFAPPVLAARAGATVAQAASLGTVRITRDVMADGQALSHGTYTLRLSDDAVPPVTGESSEGHQWMEFLQGGQVKGRALAIVLQPGVVSEVAHQKPPAAGRARVQLLRGDDYLRVWVNHAGTQYLVYLVIPKA